MKISLPLCVPEVPELQNLILIDGLNGGFRLPKFWETCGIDAFGIFVVWPLLFVLLDLVLLVRIVYEVSRNLSPPVFSKKRDELPLYS